MCHHRSLARSVGRLLCLRFLRSASSRIRLHFFDDDDDDRCFVGAAAVRRESRTFRFYTYGYGRIKE